MSFWKKIFGGSPAPATQPSQIKPATPNSEPHPSHKREFITRQKGDPQIKVNPQAITHAFIVLALNDVKHGREAEGRIVEFNKSANPILWQQKFKFSMGVLAAQPDENGFPSDAVLPEGLSQVGVTSNHSIVIYTGLWDFNGKQYKIRFGFTFSDINPRYFYCRPVLNSFGPI
jgi:hypothetical protein